MDTALRSLSQHEQLNFLLTNRIPRHAATRFVGWLSRIESPLLTRILIAIWRLFADDFGLDEAQERSFSSLQAFFIRRLKPGARPIDARADVVVSPCDAIVGECGRVEDGRLYQAKGFPYELKDLLPDPALQRTYRDGIYVTLRLKSNMYHRFHAPTDCAVREVDYISGDTWNVNPIALKRVEKLYCRNERAVLPLHELGGEGRICLVPVAAILVASMRFNGLAQELNLDYQGPQRLRWNARFAKGEEMGCFLQGSTIILFATSHYALVAGLTPGAPIRMGQALLIDSQAETS
jgi:phosphatidylserine decarboxylase